MVLRAKNMIMDHFQNYSMNTWFQSISTPPDKIHRQSLKDLHSQIVYRDIQDIGIKKLEFEISCKLPSIGIPGAVDLWYFKL